ncbi:MAG: phage tail tape measure protein [Novosphingobium sp.]|uniref:phage tail tape measure protein n=1 Tax=Novosphingobium sp. TaxID=1874826 RepID=UPI0026073FF4|nr:phage tail tape measure protein [Novosphingobium sp.]MCP5385944.1 phage tail tape measure protein [Novosphingobium sp.]
MSGSLIGALRVTLGIDTAAFEEGLGVAQKRLAAAGATMQAVGDRLTGIGARMSMIMAPIAIAVGEATRSGLEYASSLGEVAQQLGVTTDELQEFRYAASQAGIEQEQMDQALAKLTQNLGKAAAGSGPAAKAFEQLGISILDANGKVKSTGSIMPEIADALAKISDPARRAALEIAIFGKAGQKLDTLLAGGAGQMNALRDAAHELGIVLSSDDIAKADDAADKLAAIKQVLSAQIAGVVAQNSGAIVAAATALSEAVSSIIGAFAELSPGVQKFALGFAVAAAAAGPVLMVIGSLTSAIGGMIPVFAPVVALIGSAGLGGALAAAATAAAPFVAAGAAAYAIWAMFGDKLGPVLSELGGKFQEVLGPKLASLLNTVKSSLTELWNGPFGEAIRTVIDVMGKFQAAYLSALGDGLIRILSAAVTIVEGAFTAIGNVIRVVARLLSGDFSGAWTAMKALVTGVVTSTLNAIEALAPGAIAAISALVRGIQDWIGNKLSAIWEAAKDKIQALGDKFKWLWDVVVGHSYIPDMVDGIGANMARLDDVMVKPAQKAADKTAKAFEDLRGDVRGILDELFPLQAELLSTMEKIDKLDQAKAKGWLDDKTYETARGQLESKAAGLRSEIAGPPAIIAAMEDVPLVTVAVGDLSDVLGAMPAIASEAEIALEEYGRALGDNIMGGLRDVLSGRTSFRDMLKDLFGNFLYRLTTDALKGIETAAFGDKGLGGFLGGLFSGLFKGRAIGGPVLANQPYVVGEKRPELFVPSTAGRIVPNLNGMGRGAGSGPIEVRVTKSNLFDVEVTRIADGRVANGIAGYDRNVGSRVKDNMSRRG